MWRKQGFKKKRPIKGDSATRAKCFKREIEVEIKKEVEGMQVDEAKLRKEVMSYCQQPTEEKLRVEP